MDFYVKDGVIIRNAADDGDKKKKKGDGVASAIGLLQELRGFMEKVEACVEAQDIAENRQAIEGPSKSLEELYKALLKIAESGIRSLRQVPEGEEATAAPSEAPKQPMLQTPSVPELSKIGI